ncbi:DUF2500 domain-containing protein [Flavobacterium album]|nr:DUF2500 domain-containing protein [Flavobacterium album]
MEKFTQDFNILLFLWQVFFIIFWIAILFAIIRFIKRYRRNAEFYKKHNP